MKVEDIVEFKKTKNRYRVAGFGRMKSPSDGKWVDSVIYEALSEWKEGYGYLPTERNVFIREAKDFEEKFEPSIPIVQVMDSRTGQYIYDFGVPEVLLGKYFEKGFSGQVNYSPDLKIDVDKFCYNIAFDIIVGDLKKADGRLSQELLDEIRKDIKAGESFKKTPEGITELQSLLFFLSLKTTQPAEEPAGQEAIAPEEVAAPVPEPDNDQE